MALVLADEEIVLKESRDTPPAHYLFKVDSFSLFSENGLDQIESKNFTAGGHQWKICAGKGDHISIYLKLSTSSLPLGKDVNAIFKFFVYDQIRGKYLIVQEVFVTEGSCLGECLSISKVARIPGKHQWTINHFSALGEKCFSDQFVAGGHKWMLLLHPEGNLECKGFGLSLYMVYVDSSTEQKVKAEFMLTLRDQLNQSHVQKKIAFWFSAPYQYWGWSCLIELKDLKDSKKGYIVGDRCIIEAEVTVLCKTSQKTLDF